NFRIKLKTGITANSFDYQISLKNKTNSGELASKTGSVIITKDTLTTLSIISVNSLSGSLTLLTSTGTASDDFDVNIVANSYSGTEVLTSVKITTNS
ncbi:MAG: hypothetical protein LBU14_05475, partial [Candidatus Peribacteria bacterium]|nr:hypothetical protein [Candidatus Peribacteria bacterium]